MQDRARAVLVVVVFLVVIGVPLAILFASGGGDESDAKPKPKPRSTGLRVERGTSGSDLVIYVKPAVNMPERAGGRSEVVLECVDSDGDAVMAQDEQWPFQDTDQFAVGPHAHMTLDPLSITAVERCLLRGTEPLLEAPVPR
jgi:hypothetical protein